MKVYARLPPAGRSLAATVRGYYLRSWRYGRTTEALIDAAREREQWSAGRWTRYQEERLAFVLHRAATRVPYYRDQWAERQRRGDRASWEHLENWPILSKDTLRATPSAFVADDCSPGKLFRERTSGTTGKPLELWRGTETVQTFYALSELRERRWYGVSVRDRWAIFGGQVVVPVAVQRPPFWVRNLALNQIYMSTFHLSPRFIPSYLDALERYRVKYLWGYPSSLAVLAHETIRQGRTVPMTVAIGNAEPVTEAQRQVISAAFGCPVRETYGMAEMVTAASECSSGRLHQWPEVGYAEVLKDHADVPVDPGETGRLVSTSLLNTEMPLIRYEVGDRVSAAADDEPCACGRSLPRLSGIEGRTNDLIVTPDGRRVFWLNAVFYGLPLRESQIVQEVVDRVRVLVVPSEGFGADIQREMTQRLEARLGQMAISIEVVDAIPRTAGGKFRAVVSHVAQDSPGVR